MWLLPQGFVCDITYLFFIPMFCLQTHTLHLDECMSEQLSSVEISNLLNCLLLMQILAIFFSERMLVFIF